MKRCKHNWVDLLPSPQSIKAFDPKSKSDYALDLFISGNIIRAFLVCTECNCTGHHIKSYRGGIRRHTSDTKYLIDRAKEIAKRNGFEIPYFNE